MALEWFHCTSSYQAKQEAQPRFKSFHGHLTKFKSLNATLDSCIQINNPLICKLGKIRVIKMTNINYFKVHVESQIVVPQGSSKLNLTSNGVQHRHRYDATI